MSPKIYTASDMLRIRTSADLLKICPDLEEQSQWTPFVEEFNKSDYVEARTKAARSYLTPPPDQRIRELRRLCDVVRTEDWIAAIQGMVDTGLDRPLPQDDVARNRIAAAIELADKIELLLSGSTEGGRFLRKVEAEVKRRTSGRAQRNSVELCVAFMEFIHRERKLPTKKALNREANRLAKCLKGIRIDKRHGESHSVTSADTGCTTRCLVYDRGTGSELGEDGKVVEWAECRIVPRHEWEEPRWDLSAFSKELASYGFQGLPEDNAAKGQKKVGG